MNRTRIVMTSVILGATALAGVVSHASPIEPDVTLPIQVSPRTAIADQAPRPRHPITVLRTFGMHAQILGLLGTGRSVAIVLQVWDDTAESADWLLLMTTGDVADLVNAVITVGHASAWPAGLGDSISLARVRLAFGGALGQGPAGLAIAALAGGMPDVECAALEASCEGRPIVRGGQPRP